MAMLPAAFSDLEPYAPTWADPSINSRYEKRLRHSYEELQEFYDAIVPRGDAILEYLDQWALDEMPDDAMNLLWMLLSLSAVSFAIDVFKQPAVIDAGDAVHIPWTVEPVP